MRRHAAILLSRQPLRPNRNTGWVVAADQAVRWLVKQRLTLSGSVGLQTWELVLTQALRHGADVRLYLPVQSRADFSREVDLTLTQFDIHPGAVEFVPVFGGDDKRDTMQHRDRTLISEADTLIPISVRPHGGMERLIAERATFATIEPRFQIEYRSNRSALKESFAPLTLTKEARACDRFLIHWTRAVSHPWPDERKIDFYSSILLSDSWPRTAFDTLERICTTGRLLGGTRHLPRGVTAVSFSSLPPAAAVPLMRWRARYHEMALEPYGVGIERTVALDAGITPVIYCDRLPGERDPERWHYQSSGVKSDWRAEHEYRYRGNLDLRLLPPESVVLFCRNKEEAARLRDRFQYKIVAMFEE